MRKYFDLIPGEPFLLEITDDKGGTTFVEFKDAAEYAVIGNLYANINDSVRTAGLADKFFRLTLVGDEDQVSAYGIQRGWYVARWISREEADRLRQSWSILRKQPNRDFEV
jgi:hypothetical protein